jgi:nucleotide-binding universal stress UspA family protein
MMLRPDDDADTSSPHQVKHIETEVVRGTSASLVGPLLVEAAAKRDADVAVLGARGRGVLKCAPRPRPRT